MSAHTVEMDRLIGSYSEFLLSEIFSTVKKFSLVKISHFMVFKHFNWLSIEEYIDSNVLK